MENEQVDYNTTESDESVEIMADSELLAEITSDIDASYKNKERKLTNWNDNYRLSRDRVIANRLTQTQSINLPIMTESLNAWRAKVSEAPTIQFEALKGSDSSEKAKALLKTSIWDNYYEKLKFDEIAEMDKKVIGLWGLAYKHMYWADDDMHACVLTPLQVEIDPKVDMRNIDTARFLYLTGVFFPVRDLLANPDYRKEGKQDLARYLKSNGTVSRTSPTDVEQAREQPLQDMGLDDIDSFAGSDAMIEVIQGFKNIWDIKQKKYVRYYLIIADKKAILLKKPLEEALNIDFLPIEPCSDDPDPIDIYPDSKADKIRPINNVMNSWLSSFIDNRTYRNFSMFFYDSTNPKYRPTAFDPQPFAMLPVPGKPSEVVQPLPVSPLTDTINDLTYFKTLAEGVLAIPGIQKGQQGKQQTLGKDEIDLTESTEIINASRLYFRNSWEKFADKFMIMLEANKDGVFKVHKKDANGDYHEKTINKEDITSEYGFKATAKFKSEIDSRNSETMKKLSFALRVFVNNPVATSKIKEQMLEVLGWEQTDIEAVMQSELQTAETNAAMQAQGIEPQQQQLEGDITQA